MASAMQDSVEKLGHCAEAVTRMASVVDNTIAQSAQAGVAGAARGPPSILAAAAPFLVSAPQTVEIPVRQAQILYDSLFRAAEATARLRAVCESTSSQLSAEESLLERARVGLRQILSRKMDAAE